MKVNVTISFTVDTSEYNCKESLPAVRRLVRMMLAGLADFPPPRRVKVDLAELGATRQEVPRLALNRCPNCGRYHPPHTLGK